MTSSKKPHPKTPATEGADAAHAEGHGDASHSGHHHAAHAAGSGDGGHGPAEAPPDPLELEASSAARRSVARFARPVGLVVAVAGAGLSLGLAGRGDLALAAVPLVLAVHGAAVAAVSRELRPG